MTELTESFWKKYSEADYFERKDLIRELPLLQSIIKHRHDKLMDDELFTYCVYDFIQAYLDDALDVANVSFNQFYEKKVEENK